MIKNHTSNVPVDRTISRIEYALAKAGAAGIYKEYGPHSEVAALTFMIQSSGNQIAIRLPANADAVYEVMAKQVRKPHVGTLDRIREQAGKTAWKLMQDWCEVQLSLIEMQQADFIQVFLPYVWDQSKHLTFYDQLKQGGFKALPAPKSV